MYTNAKYLQEEPGEPNLISVLIGERQSFVPINPANRHYKEIMRQVEAGELTIESAAES